MLKANVAVRETPQKQLGLEGGVTGLFKNLVTPLQAVGGGPFKNLVTPLQGLGARRGFQKLSHTPSGCWGCDGVFQNLVTPLQGVGGATGFSKT